MSIFAELLANPDVNSPATVQRNAERSFRRQISRSGLHRRDPSEQIPPGVYVVIGIATYSPLELAMLDEIDSHSPSWPNGLRIDVFSVLECKSMEDLQQYLPGIKQDVYQTPIVGVWTDKKLSACTTGLAESRDLLRQVDVVNCECLADLNR